MPLLLLDLLKRYWKVAIPALACVGLLVWIGILKLHVASLESELTRQKEIVNAFKSVQKRDSEAITAQNLAVRKMWADRKKAEAASVVASGILAKAVVESQQPVKFAPNATCEDDVRSIFRKLRGEKP